MSQAAQATAESAPTSAPKPVQTSAVPATPSTAPGRPRLPLPGEEPLVKVSHKTRALLESDCKPAEFKRNVWHLTPKYGFEPEDIQSNAFWQHLSRKVKAGDLLEIFPEGGAWFVWGMILFAEPNHVEAQILFQCPLGISDTPPLVTRDKKHVIEWIDTNVRWRVRRIRDGAILRSGLANEGAARSYLNEHLKAEAL